MEKPYNYYIALVEPDNTVIIRQNDRNNRALIKGFLKKHTKIYRVRGHTVDEAVAELSKFLGVALKKTTSRKQSVYNAVDELTESDL